MTCILMRRNPAVLSFSSFAARTLGLIAFLTSLTLQATPFQYPLKPIRWICPYPPGSSADVIGRIFSTPFSHSVSQQVIVDNRPGASGNLAAEMVAKASPDGYTLLLLNTPIVSSQFLFPGLRFDPRKDFEPIAMLGLTAYLLVVNPQVPAKTVQELVSLAKSQPGQLNYASTGTGGGLHLAMELFQMLTATRLLHVPYKGSSSTVPDLISGRIDTLFGSAPSLLPHWRSGRIRTLGISLLQRSPTLPQIPTLSESGVPNFEAITFVALAAPKGVDRAIVKTVNHWIEKIALSDDTVQSLQHQSTELLILTPEKTAAFIAKESIKWQKVIVTAGIKAE